MLPSLLARSIRLKADWRFADLARVVRAEMSQVGTIHGDQTDSCFGW